MRKKLCNSILTNGEYIPIYSGTYSGKGNISINFQNILNDYNKYSSNNFLIIPKAIGVIGNADSGLGRSCYGERRGTSVIKKTYENTTGILTIEGMGISIIPHQTYVYYYSYISSYDIIIVN